MNLPMRPILLFNAGFSVLSGLLLTAAPGTVGGWLGIQSDGWLRLAGLVLLSHGLLIAALLPRLELRQLAVLNLAAIAPYPLLMVGLVATDVISRDLGQTLALVDGAIIAAVAAALALGIWRTGLQKAAPSGHPQPA